MILNVNETDVVNRFVLENRLKPTHTRHDTRRTQGAKPTRRTRIGLRERNVSEDPLANILWSTIVIFIRVFLLRPPARHGWCVFTAVGIVILKLVVVFSKLRHILGL